MQKFQSEAEQNKGNIEEKSVMIEDLPLATSKNSSPSTSKTKWLRRRPFLLVGGILLLVVAVIGAYLLSRFPYNLSSSATSSSRGPLPTPTPTQSVNGGPIVSDHSVYPTVVDGIAYVSTSESLTYALNVNTGTLLWRSPNTQGATYTPPVVDNGRVYINTYLSDTVSAIYALQAADGKLLWSHRGAHLTLQKVVNDIVYETSDVGITSSRATDGSQLWNYQAKGADAGSWYEISDVSIGEVYGSANPSDQAATPSKNMATFFALSTRDGSVLWSQQANNTLSLLTQEQGIIYTTTRNTLCAVQVNDGRTQWCRKIGPENTALYTLAGSSVFDGILYLFSTTFNAPTAFQGGTGASQNIWTSLLTPLMTISALASEQTKTLPTSLTLPLKEGKPSVYAIRIADGSILWSKLLNDGKNGWVSGFGVENGVLYAGLSNEASPGGQVYAFQSQTGKELWRTIQDTPPTYGLLANGMLSISSNNGRVDVLNLSDGSSLWHHTITAEFHTQQVQNGDTLYISDSNGVLYAFNIHNGAIHWQHSLNKK